MSPATNNTGTTGVRLVRVTTKPRRARSAVAPVYTNIDGTITARRPCVSIRRPPNTRTPIAATAKAELVEPTALPERSGQRRRPAGAAARKPPHEPGRHEGQDGGQPEERAKA